MEIQNQRIIEQLNQLNLSYQHFHHEPVFTCEAAEKIYDKQNIAGTQIKNLFLRNKKGSQHYLVIMESTKPFDIKAFANVIDDHKLGFASPERLWKYLQTKPGSVSPLNLMFDEENHTKVFIDTPVLESLLVHFHPGTNEQTIQFCNKTLKNWLNTSGNEWKAVEI